MPSPSTIEHDTIGYDINGQEIAWDSPRCVAYKNGEYRVKTYTHGPLSGLLFDPTRDYNERLAESAGRPAYLMKQVSREIFEYYVSFLQTQNGAKILCAERLMR